MDAEGPETLLVFSGLTVCMILYVFLFQILCKIKSDGLSNQEELQSALH